jgi:hypothetical protein
MLMLIEKPGAERIFPDVEAVKARFRERLEAARDQEAYHRTRGGRVRVVEGSENN